MLNLKTKAISATCILLTTFSLSYNPIASSQTVSPTPPPDKIIIQKASTLEHCSKGITEIVGKFELSNNHWQVYYRYPKDSISALGRSMWLKKLDTNIWILLCGDTAQSWATM